MGFPTEVRKYSFVSPPRAYGAAGPVGQVLSIPVSTTAGFLDLANVSLGLVYNAADADRAQSPPAPPGQPSGLVGQYLTLEAISATVGLMFAPTPQAVTGSNVPVIAQQGSVSAASVASGTNGAPTTPPGGGQMSIFTDNTALAFTSGMVGKLIQISGDGTNAGNNGTFQIVGFLNAGQVLVQNPGAITTTGLTWSVVTGGAYTGHVGTCWQIPSGGSLRVYTEIGRDLYLGYIGSGSGTLLLYQSNPSGMDGM